ncbi:hypothetical protein O5169_19695 [Escherichia coli]|nr:hypothetical protein [Escherichia coli]
MERTIQMVNYRLISLALTMLTHYFHELADIGVIEVRAVLFVLSVSCTRHE